VFWYKHMLTMSSLTPELAELTRQFAAMKTEAIELVDGLAESQFNWRPDLRNWSIAECLQHRIAPYHAQDGAGLRSERHADPDLASAARDCV